MKGVEFLNKLYKDLNISDIVRNKGHGNKDEDVGNFLNRIDEVNKDAVLHDRVSLVKKLYYDKYIIKSSDISDGLNKKNIINNQKESLDKWLDYLLYSNYPTWAKYWAFRGMLKIGTYNDRTDTYQKRSKKTTNPFIELNPNVLDECINMTVNYINKDKLTDTELDKLVKSGNFSKLYTTLLKKYKNSINNISLDNGVWVKYRQNSDDYIKLYNSIQGYNTGWCTSFSINRAKSQLKGGDFYVYYTDKIPRLAILMKGPDVKEVRGINDNQNIEDGAEDIIADKLNSLGVDTKKYLNTIKSMKELTKLNRKNDFNIDEVRFIYEANGKIPSFGWGKDPRINTIINRRNITKDLDRLTDEELYRVIYNNPIRIKDINTSRLKDDYCYLAIKREPQVIKYIPDKFITKEMCSLAVTISVETLRYIPEKFLTDDLYRMAFNNNVMALQYIPDKYKSPYMCLKAVGEYPFLISYVPHNLITNEMCYIAYKSDPTLIKDIPKDVLPSDLVNKLDFIDDEYYDLYEEGLIARKL